jgi:hypothetical protein
MADWPTWHSIPANSPIAGLAQQPTLAFERCQDDPVDDKAIALCVDHL